MSCQEFEDRLNDHAGGYLSGKARQEVDEHLLVCTACRDELHALRALLDDLSALPKDLEVPPEIWPATRQALAGRGPKVRKDGTRDGRSFMGFWLARPVPLAAAASLVLVAAVSAGIYLGRHQAASGPADVPAGAPPVVTGTRAGGPGTGALPDGGSSFAPATFAPLDLVATEADFKSAAENLLAALEAQRDKIPPGTMALVEENLRAINEAIAETHRAMESDPGNARLGRLMRAMYHSKMRLLQGAAMTPSS